MKDYRPVVSNALNLLEDLLDEWNNSVGNGTIGSTAFSYEEAQEIVQDLVDMFNEIDEEYEDGKRF